ncbi:ArsR/SmtB family transcription factor [Streptomyces sp. NPDC058045]|uniref:ArsR/SmtB family transcription factor n=1 Tax=Streptomyces sp. NPDC058045 TaxID=3346311 RepID=UPI0036F0D960
MLRIHFSDRDLARVTVVGDPMWETLLAVHQLGGRSPANFRPWRRQVAQADPTGPLGRAVRMLRTLAPPQAGYFPDFLTPEAGRGGLTAGLDALRGTRRRRLTDELVRAFDGRRPPPWVRDLARGDDQRLTELGGALRTVHRSVVAPDWTGAACAVEVDRVLRARALRDGGVHGLLRTLRPMLRWRAPVLEMDYPESRDLHLDGRGLCLVPSRFCWGKPVALADPDLPQVVVYPAQQDTVRPVAAPSEPLKALLGRTRARVLAALEGGCTTGEAARILDLAPSSVSEHITALRAAGLVHSRRLDQQVQHVLAPLGTGLLHSGSPRLR